MKKVRQQKPEPTLRFNARLEGGSVAFPKNISAKILPHGETLMEGIFNALPFRASIKSDTKGGYSLELDKIGYKPKNMGPDDMATIEITRVGNEVETRMPADFQKVLDAFPKALATWTNITPLARRDWIFWMITAKQSETRERRIEKACDMLSSGKHRVCCFGGIAWLIKSHPNR